jgi:Na+-driven multidrug efflux pump
VPDAEAVVDEVLAEVRLFPQSAQLPGTLSSGQRRRLRWPALRATTLFVPVLLVAALTQPVAGIVFVLDGVLIGAGDAVYLAWAQLVNLALFAPAVWLVVGNGLTWLWAAFGVCFMDGRAVTLLVRARSDRWMRLGA